MSLDDGERIPLGRWHYANITKIVRASKRSPAAKLYNAAIRRQTITLYIEGKKPVKITPPKPNSDFAKFGAQCGIGNLAEKK